MLFDLRGSGRRTTVKVVYLTLAVLMGGGLVLFGIGGDVSGGLVDAITDNGGSTAVGDDRFRDRATEAQRAAEAQPAGRRGMGGRRPRPLPVREHRRLLRPEHRPVHGRGQGPAPGRRPRRGNATSRWPRTSRTTAWPRSWSRRTARRASNEPEKAVRAQEIITEARPKDSTFATLAVLAYQAGQTRKGDLADQEGAGARRQGRPQHAQGRARVGEAAGAPVARSRTPPRPRPPRPKPAAAPATRREDSRRTSAPR